jgi:hypothetical protein
MSHDADVGAAARAKPPGPMIDRCGFCGEEISGLHDRMWEQMRSDEGLVAAANWCKNQKCEQRASREFADVAAYLRHRQQTDELWEV